MVPFFVGFTVAILISLFAPLTQAGWNPARDFGPRLVAWMAGWGLAALPGPRAGFWVYIVGPLVGAPIGAVLYDTLLRSSLPAAPQTSQNSAPAGTWCADQAILQRIVLQACSQGVKQNCARGDCAPGRNAEADLEMAALLTPPSELPSET